MSAYLTCASPLPSPPSPQRKYGFIMGGDGSVLAAALVCILAVGGWTMAIMTPFFMVSCWAVGVFVTCPRPSALQAQPQSHPPHLTFCSQHNLLPLCLPL